MDIVNNIRYGVCGGNDGLNRWLSRRSVERAYLLYAYDGSGNVLWSINILFLYTDIFYKQETDELHKTYV